MGFIFSTVFFFKIKSRFYFFFSVLRIVVIYFCWWRDVSRERESGYHSFEVRDGLKLGIILFIFREVLFFFAWFWGFFHRSLVPSEELGVIWPPFSVVCIDPFKVPLLNTCVLLLRGATVTWAHHSIIINNNSLLFIIYTILLGFFFTFLQGIEYFESTFNIRDNIYGRRFFVTTGFHGIHVIVGSLFLLYCLRYFFKKKITKWQHIRIEFAIWYWHFVDVVWLFLFFFIYWWSF